MVRSEISKNLRQGDDKSNFDEQRRSQPSISAAKGEVRLWNNGEYVSGRAQARYNCEYVSSPYEKIMTCAAMIVV